MLLRFSFSCYFGNVSNVCVNRNFNKKSWGKKKSLAE